MILVCLAIQFNLIQQELNIPVRVTQSSPAGSLQVCQDNYLHLKPHANRPSFGWNADFMTRDGAFAYMSAADVH